AEGESLAPGYTVLEHLSRAESLDVYALWSEQRRAPCVGKVLQPERADDPRAAARMRREAAYLLGFSHPHIVRAYELLEQPQLTLILEPLTGATLSYLI